MRTTLSLDDDVSAQLRRLQAESGESWKQVVNDVIRTGLATREQAAARPRAARRTKSVSLGWPLVGDLSNVAEVLSIAEGDGRG